MSDPTPPPDRVVWEITWRCNLACDHCLVEGGPRPRPGDLDTDEDLALADAIARRGAPRVTLTGGEPLMRRDWRRIARRLAEQGRALALSTNGHLLDEIRIAELVALSFEEVVLSVDGLAGVHDASRHRHEPRARGSSFAEVVGAVRRLQAAPLQLTVITAVHAGNLAQLPAIQRLLAELGVRRWLVQLAHPTGRMAPEAMLPRARLPELFAFLDRASRHPRLPPRLHSTLGYLDRDEARLRSSGRQGPLRVWMGCPCGTRMMGIEPDGGVKGCPNQVGAPFVVGNVREEPLEAIWRDRGRWTWLHPRPEELGGACATCEVAEVCRGGCPAVSVAVTGRLFRDPWCVRAVRREAACASS